MLLLAVAKCLNFVQIAKKKIKNCAKRFSQQEKGDGKNLPRLGKMAETYMTNLANL